MHLAQAEFLQTIQEIDKFVEGTETKHTWIVPGENEITIFAERRGEAFYIRKLPTEDPIPATISFDNNSLVRIVSTFDGDTVLLTQRVRLSVRCNGKKGTIPLADVGDPWLPTNGERSTIYEGPAFLQSGRRAASIFGDTAYALGQLAILPSSRYCCISNRPGHLYGAIGSGEWSGDHILVPYGVLTLASFFGENLIISLQERENESPLIWFSDGTRYIVCVPSAMAIPPYPSVLARYHGVPTAPFPLSEVVGAAKDCVKADESAVLEVSIREGSITVQTRESPLQRANMKVVKQTADGLTIAFATPGKALVSVLSLLHGNNPIVSLFAGSHMFVTTDESFVVLSCLQGSLSVE